MEFRPLDPHKLDELAIKYLQQAIESFSFDFFDINDYIEAAKRKQSLIFGVFSPEMIGCFLVDLKAGKGRKVLIISLLGGYNLKLWREDLLKFMLDMGKQNQCTDFSMLARKGFEKICPELTLDACIYSMRLI